MLHIKQQESSNYFLALSNYSDSSIISINGLSFPLLNLGGFGFFILTPLILFLEDLDFFDFIFFGLYYNFDFLSLYSTFCPFLSVKGSISDSESIYFTSFKYFFTI